MKRVAVICPNMREFELEAADKFSRYPGYRMNRYHGKVQVGDVEYRLVSNSRLLRGLVFHEVQKWGRWYQMPDIERLLLEAKYSTRKLP